jgi:hypothetical protein
MAGAIDDVDGAGALGEAQALISAAEPRLWY